MNTPKRIMCFIVLVPFNSFTLLHLALLSSIDFHQYYLYIHVLYYNPVWPCSPLLNTVTRSSILADSFLALSYLISILSLFYTCLILSYLYLILILYFLYAFLMKLLSLFFYCSYALIAKCSFLLRFK